MKSSSSAGTAPVIVVPHAVDFYLEDQKAHKQLLTIYNLYDYTVRFEVLCTKPDKYTVVEPKGSIKPNCSLHIVVRHNDVKLSNCNVTDKFRVQFLDYSTKKVIGSKDITATLHSGLPPNESENSDLERWRYFERHSSELRLLERDSSSKDLSGTVKPRSGPNAFIVSIGVVCIAALLMPNEGEKSNMLPIQLSCNMKLVFAYVLGLVTMVILQS